MIAYETRLGKIDITEAYLSKLIGHEVTSCFGVVGMIPSNSRQKVLGMLSKAKRADTGIRVTGNAETISVKEIAGITVDRVTIKIDGIKE